MKRKLPKVVVCVCARVQCLLRILLWECSPLQLNTSCGHMLSEGAFSPLYNRPPYNRLSYLTRLNGEVSSMGFSLL